MYKNKTKARLTARDIRKRALLAAVAITILITFGSYGLKHLPQETEAAVIEETEPVKEIPTDEDLASLLVTLSAFTWVSEDAHITFSPNILRLTETRGGISKSSLYNIKSVSQDLTSEEYQEKIVCEVTYTDGTEGLLTIITADNVQTITSDLFAQASTYTKSDTPSSEITIPDMSDNAYELFDNKISDIKQELLGFLESENLRPTEMIWDETVDVDYNSGVVSTVYHTDLNSLSVTYNKSEQTILVAAFTAMPSE